MYKYIYVFVAYINTSLAYEGGISELQKQYLNKNKNKIRK